MIAEVGVFLLMLAAALAVCQAGLCAALRPGFARAAVGAAWLQCLLLSAALGALVWLRVSNDFSVQVVAEHSNRALPLLYKIVGAWGNHEGSMLLWAWVLAVWGAFLPRPRGEHTSLAFRAHGVVAALLLLFVLFVLFTSNPFARLFPPARDGATLNPLLQDIGLAMHPPLLYMGYVGSAAVFALALAALLEGRFPARWAVQMQTRALVAWAFLTAGIALGAWWAYRELGWGGYWFWDPVENASLLPWLALTALVHANLAYIRRGALALWVLLLAIVAFAMSIIGTFLVRSGVIISVHSFASDPARGVWILGIFAAAVGGALAVFSLRAPRVASAVRLRFSGWDRDILLNSLCMLVALGIVLLGTIYPLVVAALGLGTLTVGPPYYHRTAVPVLACAVALAAWSLRRVRRRVVWVAHMGAVVVAAGVLGMGLGQKEIQAVATPGLTLALGDASVAYAGDATVRGPNYTAVRSTLHLQNGSATIATLTPEWRRYDAGGAYTSESAVWMRPWGEWYAVSAENPSGGTTLRIYRNPLVFCLWLGAALMALAGLWVAIRRCAKESFSKPA